jgi:threonine dehydrogenase-like Zn-dependent dehydrogenase
MGRVTAETRVVVVGAGAIGLLAGASAQFCGAPDVAVEARYAHQQEVAERLGLGPPTGSYDVVIEAGGSEASLHRSVELARPGGTMVVVGRHPESVAWPHQAAFVKELTTVPTLGYSRSSHRLGGREFSDAAAMLAARPDLVDMVITHRFDIEDAEEAFRAAADKSTGALRVVVHP